MSALTDIPLEQVASGVAGLLIAGGILRQVFKGWLDAKAQAMSIGTNAAAMVSAVAIGFDKDERTAILTILERIARGLEAISISQASIVDSNRHDMEEKIDFLVSRLDPAQEARERRRASDTAPVRRKPRVRPK